MDSFDVLDQKTAVFGAKLIEASAGTGKTFAIEHLFVRLLLEAPEGEEPLLLEQILAITFTRAAAREMRMRIRANLAKALLSLKSGAPWPYLQPFVGAVQAERRLEEALRGFGQAQIFTIHGFCQRMLSEFALEARALLSAREETPLNKAVRPALLDFLETQTVLWPEQIGKLRKTPEELCEALQSGFAPETTRTCEEDVALIRSIVKSCPYPMDDFAALRGGYKVSGYKVYTFEAQIEALRALFSEEGVGFVRALRDLLAHGATVLEYLSPENQKKKGQPAPFFDWCAAHLYPPLQEMVHPKKLLQRLRFAWQKVFETLLEERGLFSPDYLMQRLQRALGSAPFLAAVRRKYRAAIIDEFQDTDALQWQIFRTLFHDAPQRMLALVGDPKQSIYRFRNADLYTYFDARQTLGAPHSLDTNYRSRPALIDALNAFFGDEHVRPWLVLPRAQRVESYRPVRAGSKAAWHPGDGKEALQFFAVKELDEEALAYVAGEIGRLRAHVPSFGSFAVLVKDRTQAASCQAFLLARGLPCWTKNQSPLTESLALSALEDLFEALYFPSDRSRLKRFLAGPLIGWPLERLLEEAPFLPEMSEWRGALERQGLPAFFRAFFQTTLEGRTLQERAAARGTAFFRDLFQLVEQILALRTPSLEAIKRLFREWESANLEEEAAARRRIENDEEAIHIMTMHASKGLEFDVVFVLGAAAKTPRAEEEAEENEAEKLRQLYVALTRAKLRLYVPVVETASKSGAESPLELFLRRSKFSGSATEILEQFIAQQADVGLDRVTAAASFAPPAPVPQKPLVRPAATPRSFAPPRTIYSYTALSKSEGKPLLPPLATEGVTLHTLPRGTDTGILIHRIFERIFSESTPPATVVAQELLLSPLANWRKAVEALVEEVLHTPLIEGLTLAHLPEKRTEVEFLLPHTPHFLKGFVDLVFLWQGRLYFLDWKTNWLGETDAAYAKEALALAMQQGDYGLQASLYAEALQRAWPHLPLGGAFYLFVRGIHGPARGLLYFQPEPLRLEDRL